MRSNRSGSDPGERQEDHRVGEVARGVQAEFRTGPRPPGQTRDQLVVHGDIGEAQHDLDGEDQPDFQRNHDGSSNTASWRSTTPKRGWLRVRLNRKQGAASSVLRTRSLPGVIQFGSGIRNFPSAKE